jgi:hypothetical protein
MLYQKIPAHKKSLARFLSNGSRFLWYFQVMRDGCYAIEVLPVNEPEDLKVIP